MAEDTRRAVAAYDPPMARYGMTIPFDGVPLADQRDWIVELADLGYTDVWSSEANGADAFTPLALASTWAPSLNPCVYASAGVSAGIDMALRLAALLAGDAVAEQIALTLEYAPEPPVASRTRSSVSTVALPC